MCRASFRPEAEPAGEDPFGQLLDDFELYGLAGEVADLGAVAPVKAESGESPCRARAVTSLRAGGKGGVRRGEKPLLRPPSPTPARAASPPSLPCATRQLGDAPPDLIRAPAIGLRHGRERAGGRRFAENEIFCRFSRALAAAWWRSSSRTALTPSTHHNKHPNKHPTPLLSDHHHQQPTTRPS